MRTDKITEVRAGQLEKESGCPAFVFGHCQWDFNAKCARVTYKKDEKDY